MALVGGIAAELITSNNSAQSPLLKFPREVRDKIYADVFEGSVSQVDEQNTSPYGGNRHRLIRDGNVRGGEWAFIMSCKQVCEEAIGIYYEKTTFAFTDPVVGGNWLFSIPCQYLVALSKVRFDAIKHHSDTAPAPTQPGQLAYKSWQVAGAQTAVLNLLEMLECYGIELPLGVLMVSDTANEYGEKSWMVPYMSGKYLIFNLSGPIGSRY